MELLKKNRIPFRTKIKVEGREVDFLIGKYAIEIDSHAQDPSKNALLLNQGFIPIHLNSWVVNPNLEEWLKQICRIQ